MKNKIIDQFGLERFECSGCGESVDKFEFECNVCGENISSINEFPQFDNKEQAEEYLSRDLYKILEIKSLTDNKFGKCILVEANPIEKGFSDLISFSPSINKHTLKFIYPETQSNSSFLNEIANSSLFEVNFDDFQNENVNLNGKSITIYRHKSFFKHNTYSPEKIFFQGSIANCKISETEEDDDYSIILPNGDFYIGEIENDIISGWGCYYFAEGKENPHLDEDMDDWQNHVGYFKNGLPNGIGCFVSEIREYSSERQIEEWGNFLNGKKNGVCLCIHDNIIEVGVYKEDNLIENLSTDFIDVVDIQRMTPTFWYEQLGLWIGIIYSNQKDDYNGLLIHNNGDSYLGTMIDGFNKTKIMGLKISANGKKEMGEWTLDIGEMEPTEWAFG